ncbi:hypothetical protein [Deinococcus apachensis]|uniref:hypothetical protein n=1 Tax=Deinococcus apachensis TaxID=309886 RepID=UPI0003A95F7A|nr:hypothetical protein [Deinococcus apachensis]
MYKVLSQGSGSRFSNPMTLEAGQSTIAMTPAAQGAATSLAWNSGWQLALQFPSGFDPRTVSGGMAVTTISLPSGSTQQQVVPWRSNLVDERVVLTLCPQTQ